MFHVRLLQLRFIQHLQSDYVFRLLLARQVHVANFPRPSGLPISKSSNCLFLFASFASKIRNNKKREKSVKLSLFVCFSRRRQSDYFRCCFTATKITLLHQNRFEKFKFLNDRRTKKRAFSSVGEILFTCHRFSPYSYSLLSSSHYHSKKKAFGECDDGVESSSSSSSQHHHPVESISSRLRADDDDFFSSTFVVVVVPGVSRGVRDVSELLLHHSL